MTVVVLRTTTLFVARYWIFLKASDGSTAMRTSHLPSGVIGAITSPPNRKLLKTEPPRCAIPSTSEPFTATPPLTAALPSNSDTRTTPCPPTPHIIMLNSFLVAILVSCLYCIVRADLGADPATRTPGSVYRDLTFIHN